ncbi:hypothetical protein [Tateyamaria pelophila]|nr:hypothetical protein [Tateyamaria pelophila]
MRETKDTAKARMPRIFGRAGRIVAEFEAIPRSADIATVTSS